MHLSAALVWVRLLAAHVRRMHLATRIMRHRHGALRMHATMARRRLCHRRLPNVHWALEVRQFDRLLHLQSGLGGL